MIARILPQALSDIDNAFDWYDRQSVQLGSDFAQQVRRQISRIATQPRLFGRVSRSPRGREIRQALVARFPFLVIYELTAIEVIVVAVTHVRSSRRTWRRRI